MAFQGERAGGDPGNVETIHTYIHPYMGSMTARAGPSCAVYLLFDLLFFSATACCCFTGILCLCLGLSLIWGNLGSCGVYILVLLGSLFSYFVEEDSRVIEDIHMDVCTVQTNKQTGE